jgi:hypothetical protein
MFSVITNIYNKKSKGPTLIELFTSTRKLNKFYATTRDVRGVYHGWHNTHRYGTQVLATPASTWVHRYPSLLQWSVPLDTDYCVTCILYRCVPCYPWCTHRTSLVVKKLVRFSCGPEQFNWDRSFGFLVINVCIHGEHYETPCILLNL